MTTIENLIKDYTISEQRSSLYYLGRYIKQADAFENYKKDIFVDGIESIPSKKVISLTYELIALVEETANKKASQFSEDEFYFWMDKIAEIEDNIDFKPSEEQIQKAITEINNFENPTANDLNRK
ncbi:MAG: hypothetical protein ACK4EY_11005 [Flavipsychrobacter sp.]